MVGNCLTLTKLSTPIGSMSAIATEEGVCLLEFTDRRSLETVLQYLQDHFKSSILEGNNKHLKALKNQLEEYFDGKRQKFSVPLITPGTIFQNKVWEILQGIPYGQTKSYKEQAKALGNPEAVRAVARANGNNRISIIIPCHRVVGSDGQLTGYGGGIWRKRRLINHEWKHSQNKL